MRRWDGAGPGGLAALAVVCVVVVVLCALLDDTVVSAVGVALSGIGTCAVAIGTIGRRSR